MRLALFDIDGTLMLTGGAGMRAFYRSLYGTFGLLVQKEVVRPDGKTDPLIARELLRHFECEHLWCEQSRDDLFQSYLACLEEEMKGAQETGSLRVLEGVHDLLDALAAEPGFLAGIVTGNLEEGARIKLHYAGLLPYFRFGGYGSDSEDRTTLIRMAMERGAALASPAQVAETFVIGDTPLDIEHGRAAGARVIAVASARYTMDELRRHSPDLLVHDLTPTPTLLRFLGD